VPFRSEVLDGAVTRPAPTFAQPAPGSLATEVQSALADEGEVQGEWTLKITGSLDHMLDGVRRAIGPRAVWGDLSQGSVPRWFLNSLVYAFGVILFQLAVSAMAGYALSRLWPRGTAYALELFFLATLMLPAFLLFLPQFLMMRNFPLPTIPFTGIKLPGMNLVGTFWALILPHTAWAFSILLFRGFFDQLPDEVFQAARVDGAGEWGIFSRIVFPLSRPVFATLVIFTFLAIWSEFAWPYLVAANKQQMWTLSVGLFSSAGGAGASADAQRSMSMALISAVPPLFIFAFFQRYLVRGIALTGIKG
jgi:multiple sugar transport system permease protein